VRLTPGGQSVSTPLDALIVVGPLAPHRHVSVAPLGPDRLAGGPVQPRHVVLLAPGRQPADPLVQSALYRLALAVPRQLRAASGSESGTRIRVKDRLGVVGVLVLIRVRSPNRSQGPDLSSGRSPGRNSDADRPESGCEYPSRSQGRSPSPGRSIRVVVRVGVRVGVQVRVRVRVRTLPAPSCGGSSTPGRWESPGRRLPGPGHLPTSRQWWRAARMRSLRRRPESTGRAESEEST